jgi:DNA replicative helicase MCM subunit Mcm2 (Cdc46/Mcm family)
MGKSQMLQAVSGLAPRGVYVSGNTTTTSGLTVTVLKDSVSGDYVLEAGTHSCLSLSLFVSLSDSRRCIGPG